MKKNEIIRAILKEELSLKDIPEELQKDKDVVLAIMSTMAYRRYWEAGKWKPFREYLWECVPQELQTDRSFFLKGTERWGYLLKYASEDLRNDREFILAVLKKNLSAWAYAPAELKDDYNFVLRVLEIARKPEYGEVLEQTSYRLRDNKDFMRFVVRKAGYTFDYASFSLREDTDLILDAIFIGGYKIYDDVLLDAAAANDMDMEDMTLAHWGQKEFVMNAVKQNGRALKYASAELKRNRDISRAAVENDPEALRYVSSELGNNIEFVLPLILKNHKVWKFVPEPLRLNQSFRSDLYLRKII